MYHSLHDLLVYRIFCVVLLCSVGNVELISILLCSHFARLCFVCFYLFIYLFLRRILFSTSDMIWCPYLKVHIKNVFVLLCMFLIFEWKLEIDCSRVCVFKQFDT